MLLVYLKLYDIDSYYYIIYLIMSVDSITLKNVSKKFKRIEALKKISLVFEPNEITGLIGFNGSGKTTTFNIISGLIEKYDGEVYFGKHKLSTKISQQIFYLTAGIDDENGGRVIPYLRYMGGLYGLNKEEIMTKVNSLAKLLKFSQFLKYRIKELSKGNQQKVKLISAFLNPNLKYLLMDEPFDGLDPMIIKIISNYLIQQKNKINMIITSHRLDIVDELCDSFYILRDGKLIDKYDKNNNNKTLVLVNKETKISLTLKRLSCVKKISYSSQSIIIELDDEKNFVKLSKELLKCNGYYIHEISRRNIAKSVMEGYE